MPVTATLAALAPILALIAFTPDPIAFQIGPIPVAWYGICYAIGLAAAYLVITWEARRRGLDARLVDNGIIIVAAAALVGGRLYHVIDQWHLYQDDPIKIILPPYAGLGVYGGIITGTITAWYLTRRWHQSFPKWADVIAPGLFVMQAIGRWGNFFNQELYGPPTNLPWGIQIDCAHRVGDHGIAQYPCSVYPEATTGFHPLFLYESISGALGAVTLLWIARRYGRRMRPGDIVLIFFIWYAAVRLVLETFRMGNWTFFNIPTAIIVSAAVIVISIVTLAWRHRPGAVWEPWGDPPEAAERPPKGEEWFDEDEDETGVDEGEEATAGGDVTQADDGGPSGEGEGDDDAGGADEAAGSGQDDEGSADGRPADGRGAEADA